MAKPKKSTVLICIGLFFAGLVFMFPLQNLKGLIFQKILEQTGVLIVAEEIHPLFMGWPGIGIKNVNVTLPVGMSDIELASQSMSFRLRLSWPFIPTVSLSFDELKGGGDLFLKVGQRGPQMSLGVDASEFNLSQIAIPGLSQSMAGILDSDISLKVNEAVFSETQGKIIIKGKNFKTPAILVNNPLLGPPFQIPELAAGDLDVRLKVDEGNLSIQSFKLGNPQTDLSGSITGDAKLGMTPLDTQVNLTLKLVFSQKILSNQEYKTFLDFLGAYRTATEGEYAMNWTASIREIVGLTKALPTPVR